MKKIIIKIFFFLLFCALVACFFIFDLKDYLTLSYLRENIDLFRDYYIKNRFEVVIAYFVIYVATTALSLPGAAVLTLAGGAVFGLFLGTVIVSFASSLGALIAFLIARFFLRDYVQTRFKSVLSVVNAGIKKDGALYLLSLRLVPVFPFFLINLVMSITSISGFKFYIVSQIGMLLGTIVYVNAGSQLSMIASVSDILSPALLGSFVLLGVMPIIGKSVVGFINRIAVYKNYKKPKKFDYNMVVVGGGAGGLVSSYIAAAVKAKVCLIENDKMGGDCLNTGCVPSKAIIKSAKIIHSIKNANEFGVSCENIKVDFAKVMARVQEKIKSIEPHDSVERYESLGVECIKGYAKITSPWSVQVGDRKLTTKNIIIASGGQPFVPNIKGLDRITPLTSDNIWEIKKLPEKLVIVGGGIIGCEMAQVFSRMGSKVYLIEMLEVILSTEDKTVSDFMKKTFEGEGIEVITTVKVEEVIFEDGNKYVSCGRKDSTKLKIEFDEILIAVGRKARTDGFGLQELGIELRENGTISTNEYLQTKYPNIYVCGDATGPFQLTHASAHQAWFCAVNSLFGMFKRFKVDYSHMSWCVYTDPEVASVGMNESSLKKKNIDYEVYHYSLDELDRAIVDSSKGFVRVYTHKNSDKILGAIVVGNAAGEMIIEFVHMIKNKQGLSKILSTIHPYPTMSEANKYVAGLWKKSTTSARVFKLLEKIHKTIRG
jgi:dihydrolipoamide dehydrogenase